MRFSTDRSVRFWTLPLAAVFSLLLPLLHPENPRLQNVVNHALPSPLDRRLVLIGIDDASLRDYGRMDAWPRELYRAALTTLEDAGVQAVALDILLTLPPSTEAPAPAASTVPLVLATAPGDVLSPFPPQWQVTTGVSALNAPEAGVVSKVQAGYPTSAGQGQAGQLQPSFARQVAAQVAPALPLDSAPRLIRYTTPQQVEARTIPFREVVNGHVRFAELQGKVAVVGLTASGLSNQYLQDVDHAPVHGSVLQLRAISSLLTPPLQRLPLPLTMLACLLATGLALRSRGPAGFVVAGAALFLTLPLWKLNIVFPGVTVSLAALLGITAVAFEDWWRVRRLSTQDHLTGFGNRLAFTRAVEHRWRGRAQHDRPVGLLLIDLDNLRQIRELHGRLTGAQALKAVAGRIQERKRRGDMTFRWGTDEFAVLLDPSTPQDLADAIAHYFHGLEGLDTHGTALQVNVGGAVTGPDIRTPRELIDAASRHRYRLKYQRELQAQSPQVPPRPEP